MPVVPPGEAARLATASDLEVLLQRTFTETETAAAELVLDLVSAAIRSYTGQQFTYQTTTARLRLRRGKLRLPQRPVVEVTAVTTTAEPPVAVTYEWDGFGSVELSTLGGIETNAGRANCGSYLVTYTHGYATVPEDIRAVTLQVAGRAFGTPADQTGVQSENIGGYGYSVGGAAASGAVGFLAGERAVLDRYKVPASAVVMERL